MWLRAFCWLILALLALPAYADPILGTAGSFGVLGSTVTNTTGSTAITGNVGVSPTGFPPGTATGTIYNSAVPITSQAQSDASAAYTGLAGMAVPPGNDLTGTDLGGLELTPGVYKFDSSADLTGTLILNGKSDNNDLWVFLIGSTLTTASDSSVNVSNAGSNDGIFWDVGSTATLGASTEFDGNILAVATVTLGNGTTIGCGSALAPTVTMNTNTISTGCGGGGTITSGGVVTADFPSGPSPVPEPGSMALLGSGLVALAGLVRRKLRK